MQVGLIDYGRGNLRSVEKALERCGAQVRRLEAAAGFAACDALVLPGVGAFGDAMANLRERGLASPILDWLRSDKPFLGICLGYQLLFENSVETPGVPGLGWLKGQVVRFPESVGKIPHIGWNPVRFLSSPLSAAFPEPASFYHVHSFYPEPAEAETIACTTDYGVTFASGIRQGNVMAFQFHPEKSQANGLKLLSTFLETAAVAV